MCIVRVSHRIGLFTQSDSIEKQVNETIRTSNLIEKNEAVDRIIQSHMNDGVFILFAFQPTEKTHM